MDWQQLIDEAIDETPALRVDVERRVEAGRSALRRGASPPAIAAGAAATVVVGAMAWALPQGATSSQPPVTGSGRPEHRAQPSVICSASAGST